MGDFGFVCRVTKHILDKLVQKHDLLREPKLRRVIRDHIQTPKFGDVALQKDRDPVQGPTLLMALSVLCECNGVPIKRNQGNNYFYR